LLQWGIADFKVVRNLGGSARASWLVDTGDGHFVARRIVGNRDYLSYQLTTLDHLGRTSLPLELPQPRKTARGALMHDDGEAAWILYRFIDGAHPDRRAYPARARELGALVGAFDQAVMGLNLGAKTGSYRLSLFRTEDAFLRPGRRVRPSDARDLFKAGDGALERALAVHERILPVARGAVSALPLQTIYNDWHPNNVLERGGNIVGLIDFDSLVEAPRVVDVQNALAYVLMNCATPDIALAEAFLGGYESSAALPSRERDLLWPVMMDRLLWLVFDVMREKEGRGRSHREALAIRAIRVLDWIACTGLCDKALQ
jgi:Ser/Thr protein kinase RdoA (MazF antagonist)